MFIVCWVLDASSRKHFHFPFVLVVQEIVKTIATYLLTAMSGHISAVAQQAAVTNEVPEPPQHGLTNHNLQFGSSILGSQEARDCRL
jgi:hypothetical protein